MMFNTGFGISVLELHSRMSQASRNRASNTFREAKCGILFTSDVSARGVDYPEVSLVVQVSHAVNLKFFYLRFYLRHLF
jgi:ATP-dependent RNA helicase MSS116